MGQPANPVEVTVEPNTSDQRSSAKLGSDISGSVSFSRENLLASEKNMDSEAGYSNLDCEYDRLTPPQVGICSRHCWKIVFGRLMYFCNGNRTGTFDDEVKKMTKVTRLPLPIKGYAFRSCMPFGTYDKEGEAWDLWKQSQVNTVVCLCPIEECYAKTGKNFMKMLQREGFRVIYVPIINYRVVSEKEMKRGVHAALGAMEKGDTVVIHCSAGVGRTGMMFACIAKTILGLTGTGAIEWTRKYILGAIQTKEQERFVIDYCP